MTSIRDVAREAKVGVSTVWRVVNQSDRVRQATREKVHEAIRRVGYQPRKSKRDKRAAHLAFIYTLEALQNDRLGSYCRKIAAGIQLQAHRYGMAVSLFRGTEHAADDPLIHDLFKGQPFDGVILLGPEPDNGYLEPLVQTGLPLVVFNRPVKQDCFSGVTVDFHARGRLAAEHLVGLGHRRIAVTHVMGAGQRKWLSEQTMAGFDAVLAQHSIEPIRIPIDRPRPNTALTWQQIEVFCRAMLDAGVTAMISHDCRAVGCADQLERWGIRVPEQISVMGYDDLGLHTARNQRVTATGFSKRQMGRLAVRMLRDMMQARGGIRWQFAASVPVRLVEGATTAPPGDPAGGSSGDSSGGGSGSSFTAMQTQVAWDVGPGS